MRTNQKLKEFGPLISTVLEYSKQAVGVPVSYMEFSNGTEIELLIKTHNTRPKVAQWPSL